MKKILGTPTYIGCLIICLYANTYLIGSSERTAKSPYQFSTSVGKDKNDCGHREKIRKIKADFMEVNQSPSNPNIRIGSVCSLAGQCPTYSGSIENDSDLQKPIQINSSSEIPTIKAQKLYVEISDMSRPKSNNRSAWFDRYEELVSYAKVFGHARVPIKFADNLSLGNWVMTQRSRYKKIQNSLKIRMVC